MNPAYLLLGSASRVTACYVTSQGQLVSGSDDGMLYWWNLKTRRPINQYKAHDKKIIAITYLERLNICVSQGRDGYIRFWKVEETNSVSEAFSSLPTNALSFCPISVWSFDKPESSESGYRLAHVSNEEGEPIEIVHLPSHTVQFLLEPSPPSDQKLGMCMALQGSPKGVLAAFESGHVVLFSGDALKQKSSTPVSDSCIMCMAYHQDTGKAVIGNAESELTVFTLDRDTLSIIFRVTLTNPGVSAVHWRTDGRLFCTGGWDGRVRIFSAKKGRLLAVLEWGGANDVAFIAATKKEHMSSVHCVLFSPDNYLISGHGDKAICFWDAYRNE